MGFAKKCGGRFSSFLHYLFWVTFVTAVASAKPRISGGVACNLAVKKPHAGLVLLSTFTTLPERAQEFLPIFPVKWFMKSQFDNRSKLSQYTGPLLIAHGDHDDVVPIHHGEELFAGAVSPRKEFCHIPGGTHVVSNQELFRRVAGMMATLSK